MKQKNLIIQGTLILTFTGFISRIIGFFYRIFLSHTIGAEGIGIYQLIFPVYAMIFSLTSSGIQTAISRNVSAKIAVYDQKGARDTFLSGLLLTMIQTIAVSFFVYKYAYWIAESLLHEQRCEYLLRILAFSIPFAGIHSCINGYYFGLKKTNISAISQFLEQISRIASSYLIYIILLEKHFKVTPALAVYGLVCAEIISALFSITAISLHFAKKKLSPFLFSDFKAMKGIVLLSLPLTANRVLINLLQSIEAVCIPLRLQKSGLSVSFSLEIYGVLMGMALPLILFPSAFTNAISIMLLPTVSEAQASGQSNRIRRTIEATLRYSLALGILCTGVFLSFGKELGTILFSNTIVGGFILILAWICPFLYLSATLTSILNGLGKTMMTFWQNTISIMIRISFVWFAVPHFGITGYLWGLLVSQLVSSFFAIYFLSKCVKFSFRSYLWLVKPIFSMFAGIGIVLFLRFLNSSFGIALPPVLELGLFSFVLVTIYLYGSFHTEIYSFLSKKSFFKS